MSYKSHAWSNAEGDLGGFRAYVRINESIRAFDRSRYPYVLLVTLVFRAVGSDGIPANDGELTAADQAEEAIADRLEAEHGALVGMMVTSDGTRDLFFFLPARPTDEAIARLIASAEPALDYDFTFTHDPEWGPYAYLHELGEGG